ncbi:MAG: Ni/Fe hydrogenase subunit alpha [Candidatus Diapherotrites archaeon]
MHSCDISLNNITKIEGHAHLNLKVRNNKVQNVQFIVSENNRFFEKMVLGKSYEDVPSMVGRICGFCSTAHIVTAFEAFEKVFKVENSIQTGLLRELLYHGMNLKSHALHLYMLVLPDYLGKESVLEFNKSQHELIHQGLRLKKVGTEILRLAGGRAYHTLRLRVGGFSKLPTMEELDYLHDLLEKGKKDANECIALFSKYLPKFERKTEYVALVGTDYCFLCGTIASSNGIYVAENDYLKHLKEFVVPYSTAKSAKFAGKEYMVGALARINLNGSTMKQEVKNKIKEFKLKFPNESPFYNNISQALEILQSILASQEIIDELRTRLSNEKPVKFKVRAGTGVGVTEAPRGTLYHQYTLNSQGRVTDASIVVPTNQNNHNIEEDIRVYAPQLLKLPKPKIELELEKLIRAYDPCISCATHFLKVKWE